ncbi:membrane associated rhomboid family serine protease [Cellulosimicrobium cellulans]|uniref:rhomboid family intramembrane serine protease n=1 Tax=Cellulosimicrobium cellulans TaxID=1710 RepID=UPI001FCC2C9B|nr:rhomboid family intramembrane serine protease [Cellulosimicrobium cellulans]MBM7817825.1 membrane associated rhomboid family serine protease [Cellulosimicrobium cellulans]
MSYVRCQRCGRPACPECQRPAAVGVQCVDCVREAARQAPSQRSALGGKVRGGPPVVTFTIIGLCVVSWILQFVTGGTWTALLAFRADLAEVEPYRFLSSAFIHSTSPVHILFNMYALWVTGPFLEQMLGRWRFVALYLLAAVGGSVGYLLLAGGPTEQAWYVWVFGASGAVFGLFGAILLVLRRTGRNAMQIVVLIGINFAIGLFFTGIAWQAHLGGLVVGLVLGAAYAYAPKERRTLVSVGATAVVAVGLVVAAWLTYASADQLGHLVG